MSAARPRQTHRVRGNHGTAVPARHVVLAFTSSTVDGRREWRHVWRDGYAVTLWRTDAGVWHSAEHPAGTPAAVWTVVDGHTRRRSRTVVWCQDLGYHVRVGDALRQLDALGWTYVSGNDVTKAGWMRWAKGDRTLMLVDTLSVWPVAARVLRRAVSGRAGGGQVDDDDAAPAPSGAASYAALLTKAVRWYVGWLVEADQGRWQPTGAGQAWAAWRHLHMPYPPMVHDVAEALAAERRAMWTGRCEAWRWGRDDTAPVHEWDMQTAYCRIAADSLLPARLVGEVSGHNLGRVGGRAGNRRYLALCHVRTALPTVPVHSGDGIIWPTGAFDTVLWDNEVIHAREFGAEVRVDRAWEYLAVPVLKEWGEYTLARLSASTADIHPLERIIHKDRSRALIGRLALRYPHWETLGTAPHSDWRRMDTVDYETGARSQTLWIGRTLKTAAGKVEGPDSLPAIVGWIMAECRVRLWRCAQAAGPDSVLYMDTDSLVVDTAGHRRLTASGELRAATGLREIGRHRGYDIRGPRQLWLGDTPKLAGVPRDAVRTGPDTARGAVTEGLPAALSRGRVDTVVIRDRTWHITGTDRRRAHLPGGGTTPLEFTATPADATSTA